MLACWFGFIIYYLVIVCILVHDYGICFVGSPCYNVSFYNWLYYINYFNKTIISFFIISWSKSTPSSINIFPEAIPSLQCPHYEHYDHQQCHHCQNLSLPSSITIRICNLLLSVIPTLVEPLPSSITFLSDSRSSSIHSLSEPILH